MENLELKIEALDLFSRIYDSLETRPLFEFLTGSSRVLFYLYRNKDHDVNPAELSEKLSVSRQRIATEITQLKSKGYITVKASPNDRRCVIVKITEMGLIYILSKAKAVNSFADDVIEKIGVGGLSTINSLLSEYLNSK